MATTVTQAFVEFQRDRINLDPEETKRARASRDWLIEVIHKFPDSDPEFPTLYNAVDIQFGSFARRTQRRPLADIDIMVGISAESSTYYTSNGITELYVSETATRLKALCNEGNNVLNSIKVINQFIADLKNVPQYSRSEINRNQEATVLNLTSYDWSFDIVPCFFTKPEFDGRTYYLIPDGSGNWKKTDPRIDNERVASINQYHDGNVLNVVRLLKYWNKRPTMPSAPSHMFENIILNHFQNRALKESQFADLNLQDIFYYVGEKINNPVADPKGIQGDLNTLSNEERSKIALRAYQDCVKAIEARKAEQNGQAKESIDKWREIFGDEYPKYE